MQILKNIKDFFNPPQPLKNKYELGERVVLHDFGLDLETPYFSYPEGHLVGTVVKINSIHRDSEGVSYRFEESGTDSFWPENLINHRVNSNQDFMQILVENGYLAQFLTRYFECEGCKEYAGCRTADFSNKIQNWLEKTLKVEKEQKDGHKS